MFFTSKKRHWLLVGIGLIAIAVAGLFWQHLHEDHAHGHDDHAATTTLTLNDGKKWATDAPLRQGMQRIQALIKPLEGNAHGVSPEQAAQVAKGVQDEVNTMIKNCKLVPKADATLHVLIVEMLKGAEALTAKPASNQGLSSIQKAIEQYPLYFDHPDWQKQAES